VSAILIYGTLQTTFSLSDGVINEAPWQCASLQHDRLLQLMTDQHNSVKLPVVVDLLVRGRLGTIWRNQPELLDAPIACDILTSQVRDSFAQCAMALVAPSSALHFL